MSRNADCNSIHRRFVTEDTWTKVAQLEDAWYSPELTVGLGMVFMPQADAPLLASITD